VALEGKLLRPWVNEIRELFCQRVPAPLPRLDLSALTFADGAGVELLQDLVRQGARVESCSAFVAALLQLNDSPEVPRPHEEGAP
jgi:ABC-type transporter Mla MlaB component